MDLTSFISDKGNLAEWVTALVALVAVVLSWCALRKTQKIAQNTDFFHIHETLMSIDVQRGRSLLYREFKKGAQWKTLYKTRRDDFDAINHALGNYQTLGQYARLRHVSRRRVKHVWYGAISGNWDAIESFISYRRKQSKYENHWDDLVWLGRKAGADVTIPYKRRRTAPRAIAEIRQWWRSRS